MPWFEFRANFDWRPAAHTVINYRAGHTLLITTAAAEAATAAGLGSVVAKPGENRASEAPEPVSEPIPAKPKKQKRRG